MIVNPIQCIEVWLGAENPAGTVYKYPIAHLYPTPTPHTSLAEMRVNL
jgi:hypothetical protein